MKARMGLFLGLAFTACEGNDPGEAGDETGGAVVDADAVVAAALTYADYDAIAAAPFASAHGLASTVMVWVPPEWSGLYRAVDPGDPAASANMPPGTLLIKEHLDAAAQPSGLTIMYKGPSGYDPEHGDWWWGNAALDGTLTDEGAVDYCINCHEPRESADWVFGIAPNDQS